MDNNQDINNNQDSRTDLMKYFLIKFLGLFFNNPSKVFNELTEKVGLKNLVVLDDWFFLYDKEETKDYIQNKNIVFAGFCLGLKYNNKFFPSVDLLSVLKDFKVNKVFVDGDSIIRFVYGKDIHGVVDKNCIIKEVFKNKLFLIVNSEGNECVGFGRLVRKKGEENNFLIRNFFDVGEWLRLESKIHKNSDYKNS